MNEFLAETAIRRIVSALEFAPWGIGQAVVGIGSGLRYPGRSRDKRSHAEWCVDVRLDDKALDNDRKKSKERRNTVE